MENIEVEGKRSRLVKDYKLVDHQCTMAFTSPKNGRTEAVEQEDHCIPGRACGMGISVIFVLTANGQWARLTNTTEVELNGAILTPIFVSVCGVGGCVDERRWGRCGVSGCVGVCVC